MQTILAGYNIEKEKIDKINELVTPEVISAAYARISRSKKSVTELREEARSAVQKARNSNDNIIFEMGHSSIAEHAVFNFDILGVSRYMSEWIQKSRIASFTEKSQRYVTLKGDYVVPAEISNTDLENEFCETVETLNELYDKLYQKARKSLSLNDFDGSKKLLQGRAKEDARYVLPLATETQMGMTINARSLENLLRRLDRCELNEAKELRENLQKQVKIVAPSLIRYTKTDMFSSKILSLPKIESNKKYQDFSLLNITDNPEEKILAGFYLSQKGISSKVAMQHIRNFSDEELARIYEDVFSNIKPYHPLPKEFETVECEFEMIMSSSCFAQLKRHRMSTIIRSDYSPEFGYVVPPLLENLEMNAEIEKVMQKVNKTYHKLESFQKGLGNYILTNSHKLKVYFKANLREIFHFVRLRSDAHAQWEIRILSDKMIKELQPFLPNISKYLLGKDKLTAFLAQKDNG